MTEFKIEVNDDGGSRDALLSWSIHHMTVGPEGRFLLFDDDGDPRLIVDGDELKQLTEGGLV